MIINNCQAHYMVVLVISWWSLIRSYTCWRFHLICSPAETCLPSTPAILSCNGNWQYLSGVLRISGSWIVFGAFGKMEEEDHHFLPPPTIFSRAGRMEQGPAGENPTWRKCSKHRSPREWRQIRDQSAAYGPSWYVYIYVMILIIFTQQGDLRVEDKLIMIQN